MSALDLVSPHYQPQSSWLLGSLASADARVQRAEGSVWVIKQKEAVVRTAE